jgi:cell division transport system permease protein
MFDYAMFIVGEAFVAFRRNLAMAFAGITTGAIALFLMGLLAFAVHAASAYAEHVPKMFDMRAFLVDGISPSEIDQTIQKIRTFRGVTSVVLIPRESAWKKMKAIEPSLTNGLDNPLPNQLKVVVSDLKIGDSLAQNIQSLPTVVPEEGVHYLRQEQRLTIAVLDAFNVLGMALALLLAFSTGILIYNTIRLTVISRRLEIRIMQLVGASAAAIKIPFLIEGALQGMAAGGSAALLLWLSVYLLGRQLSLNLMSGVIPVAPALLAMVLIGGGYGLLCSIAAVRVPLQYR